MGCFWYGICLVRDILVWDMSWCGLILVRDMSGEGYVGEGCVGEGCVGEG